MFHQRLPGCAFANGIRRVPHISKHRILSLPFQPAKSSSRCCTNAVPMSAQSANCFTARDKVQETVQSRRMAPAQIHAPRDPALRERYALMQAAAASHTRPLFLRVRVVLTVPSQLLRLFGGQHSCNFTSDSALQPMTPIVIILRQRHMDTDPTRLLACSRLAQSHRHQNHLSFGRHHQPKLSCRRRCWHER